MVVPRLEDVGSATGCRSLFKYFWSQDQDTTGERTSRVPLFDSHNGVRLVIGRFDSDPSSTLTLSTS